MKRRLLFLISRFLDGGIDTMLVEYLRNINLNVFDVTLAVGIKMDELEVHLDKIPKGIAITYLVDRPALTKWRKKKITGHVNAALKLYDEMLLNPVRKAMAAQRMRNLIGRHDAIIDFDATFYTALRHCEKPVVGFYHFSISENLARNTRHTMRQMNGMSRYRRIILISDTMVEEGISLFPQMAGKFTRIYNGYDFATLQQRGEAPLPAGAAIQDTPYFISVARLEESQKDTATLLKAYSMFRQMPGCQTGNAPRLVLVGDGRDRARLEQLAKKLGLTDSIKFTGFQPDAAPWIKRSMALILSSKYEGFGLVLVEAMTLGRPVIATDCPSGPAEVLDGGKAGILVPPGDAKALAEAMYSIATNPALRHDLEEKATLRSRIFDIHHSIDQLIDILK